MCADPKPSSIFVDHRWHRWQSARGPFFSSPPKERGSRPLRSSGTEWLSRLNTGMGSIRGGFLAEGKGYGGQMQAVGKKEGLISNDPGLLWKRLSAYPCWPGTWWLAVGGKKKGGRLVRLYHVLAYQTGHCGRLQIDDCVSPKVTVVQFGGADHFPVSDEFRRTGCPRSACRSSQTSPNAPLPGVIVTGRCRAIKRSRRGPGASAVLD